MMITKSRGRSCRWRGKSFECSDIILKVKEPLFNSDHNKHEVEMMHAGQTLVTFLHPAAPANHGMVKDLAAKGL